jgi:hypothetical protein
MQTLTQTGGGSKRAVCLSNGTPTVSKS